MRFDQARRPAGGPRFEWKWNWRIGRVLGIDLFLHSTFFLLLAFLALSALLGGGGLAALLSSTFLIFLVFGTVVLHELGHALAARRYGIPTIDIILLPIGGVARLARQPTNPWQELVVALAGPAVNGVLAILCMAGLYLAGSAGLATNGLVVGLLTQLLWINVVLGAFNLIPAFPMDGGRALRAALASRLGRYQATQIAASIGRGFAILFGVIGLFFDPFLVLIAIFIWFAAGQEAQMARFLGSDRPTWRPPPRRSPDVRHYEVHRRPSLHRPWG